MSNIADKLNLIEGRPYAPSRKGGLKAGQVFN
jgi:hypothetical protein